MLAEFFLFLATTYHFWVQIMILILVGQLPTLRFEFGLGEVCVVHQHALHSSRSIDIKDYNQNSPPQDSPLGGNPEVGNPESISYQDYPPQLSGFYALFVHVMGPG